MPERMTIRKALGDFILKANPIKTAKALGRIERMRKAGYNVSMEIPSALTAQDLEEAGANVRAYLTDETEENGEKQIRVSFKSRVKEAFASSETPEAFYALVGSLLTEKDTLERASLTETLSEALSCGATNQDLGQAVVDFEVSQEQKKEAAAAKVKAAK